MGTGTIATTMDHNLIAEMSLKQMLIHAAETEQVLEQYLSKQVAELPTDRRVDPLADHLMATEAELRCASCHLDRDAHRGMFGLQCSSCHNTQVWMISEYRHIHLPFRRTAHSVTVRPLVTLLYILKGCARQ